jgi:hypothetical protein
MNLLVECLEHNLDTSKCQADFLGLLSIFYPKIARWMTFNQFYASLKDIILPIGPNIQVLLKLND